MNDLTHLDLFSGVGGFALAAQRAGFRTVGFSEIEPYACRVLAERFPGIPNLGDVRDRAAFAGIGPVTLLTGGYPCQPFSTAGLRGGHDDDRHLWEAMRHVIAAVRPTWVIGENVLGHVTLGLDQVLSDLASDGYSAQPLVIPACAVNAPHRRDRVWILAYAERVRERGQQSQHGETRRVGRLQQSVAWNRDWEGALREFRGVDDGLSYGMDRVNTLRNAIVPQVAEPFCHWVAQIEQGELTEAIT